MFITTIGCDNFYGNGSIDQDSGMFGILDEKFVRVKTGNIVIARNQVTCPCRMDGKCSIECEHAVHTVISGGKVSFRDPNKRI